MIYAKMATAACRCLSRRCFPAFVVTSYRDIISMANQTGCENIVYTLGLARIAYTYSRFIDDSIHLDIPPQHVDWCIRWMSMISAGVVKVEISTTMPTILMTVDGHRVPVYEAVHKPRTMYELNTLIALSAARSEHLLY